MTNVNSMTTKLTGYVWAKGNGEGEREQSATCVDLLTFTFYRSLIFNLKFFIHRTDV